MYGGKFRDASSPAVFNSCFKRTTMHTLYKKRKKNSTSGIDKNIFYI